MAAASLQVYCNSFPSSTTHERTRQYSVICSSPNKTASLKEAVFAISDDLFCNKSSKCLDAAFSSVLDLCASQKSLSHGKQVHAHVLKCNNVYDVPFLNTKLVLMYGKCGSLDDAEELFDAMLDRSIFTYNAMLGAYVLNGEPQAAIELYAEMRFLNVTLDAHTCSCVLKACADLKDMYCGKEIHGLGMKFGISCNHVFVNSLVNMYAKCNDLNTAVMLFERMSGSGDAVLWNLMISAYGVNGINKEAWNTFIEMQKVGVSPSTFTFVAALQACDDLFLGMQMHAVVLKSDICSDCYVANALVLMYSKFYRIDEAARVFTDIHEKDDISWNSMLACYVQNSLYVEALSFFRKMASSGQPIDQVSIISVLSACGRSENLVNGMEVHAFVLKNGMELHLQVSNTITDMYAKCSETSFMNFAFHRIPHKDSISWTTLIGGYVRNCCYKKALQSFMESQEKGIEIDKLMIEGVLQICQWLKSALTVREIHGCIVRQNFSDIILQNSLVDLYGECGEVNYASHVFRSIKAKTVVSWTSLITCYTQNGLANEALEFSSQMLREDVELDSVAILSILSTVATLSTLKKGAEIHGYLIKNYLNTEDSIASSLVDMYASCGAIDNACKVFNSVENKDLVMWTSMINAYGMHGFGMMAINLFRKMETMNIQPDHIVFLALLHACSHSSLVSEGKQFFQIMQHEYKLDPWPEHYACLVDILGRAKYLEEAFELVKSMKHSPTASVWCALLGACRTHSDIEIGEIAANNLLEMDPENPGYYILVSNVFAASERWEDVERVRMKMKLKGLNKEPACSWIAVENKVHTFMSGDKSHPNSDKIYDKLSRITEKLKKDEGYEPQTKYVLYNLEEEEKIEILYSHSERLAITYGLLITPNRTTIRVTKNLRVCGDCHTFTKIVSKFCEREIIVRDANRFHHFKGGVCSCGDF